MRSWLTPRLVLPLYEAVSGRRFWSEFSRQKRLQWRPGPEIESRTVTKLGQLVSHAAERVPFYRTLYEREGVRPDEFRQLADLERFPIVTKAEFRGRPLKEVTAEGLPSRRRVPCSTSGSTGAPFEFYLDAAATDRHLGSFLLSLDWAGVNLWDLRVDLDVQPGRSWISRLSSPKRTAVALRRVGLGQDVRNIGYNGIGARELVEEFEKLPRKDFLLRVYPSQAGPLAREILDRRIELSRYPKAVISTAESLSPANRTAIAQVFRCPVVDDYSCWEALHMVLSCPDDPDRFHVNSELVQLRVVREDGSTAEVGETGRILLTSLTNEAMPFINYELGDRGALGEPCPCGRGFPTLDRVEGRTDEVLEGRDGRFVSPIVLNQLASLEGAHESISEFQLVETKDGGIVVRVVPRSKFDELRAEAIRGELAQIFGEDRKITVESVPEISRESSGKRLIIKRMAPD